ncbi:transposase [Acetivibrio clariflavus DSM 19732]|uniref:Transposase n=3 Tax=Acetivibrio clariflavus TaxID=288965 RepID=G8LZN0_ACECE|nr:transposase [Acetivibrio clariflavus DSM 19732]
MLSMTQKNHIRKMYYEQGISISQISRETNFDRKTIRKYIDKTDWNEDPIDKIVKRGRPEKLKPFKDTIDKWLMEDKTARRKQRHTAKRIFERLTEIYKDEFDCCYKTVSNYVRRRKKEIYAKSDGYLPLEHKPGEAQVDFGEADFYLNGRLYNGYYINISFPYSNQGYTQLFKGQNQECLFEGLINIFKHIHGVPYRIWFDNASTIVAKVLKGGDRDLTDDFLRFKEHYNFEAVFCNPNSGHEKGSVESKVGYHRRNMFVPIPKITNLEEFNKELLIKCDNDADREHYRKEMKISELHIEDRKSLIPLPTVEFDTGKYLTVKTNGYGKFTLNNGIHEYSTSPKYANEKINIRITANEVIILDENYRETIKHTRLYGDTKQESMQWLPYLNTLAKRPGALKYSGIYNMLPHPMKEYMETCSKSEKGKILQTIATICEKSNFETAVKAVREALLYGAADADSLTALFSRLNTPELDLKPARVPEGIPKLKKVVTDVSAYDALIREAGGSLC